MLKIVKVVGNSMQPSLNEGDFVLATRLFRSLKVGDLVLCNHPRYSQIIKRIADIQTNGNILLKGDNPNQSVTPEQMGWIPRSDISAKVIYRIRK